MVHRVMEAIEAAPLASQAKREQAAHDKIQDATEELARSRHYVRVRLVGLAAGAILSTGSVLVMGFVAWWAGFVPLVISVVGMITLLCMLIDPPSWVDRRADERALRSVERELRDVLIEKDET